MSYRSVDSLGENPKEIFEKVVSILMRLIENVVKNPTEPKYRKIRLENKTISTYVLPSIGGMECLFDMGFVEGDDSLILPNNVSIDKLTNFQQALRNKRDVVLNKNVPAGNAPVASGSSSDLSRPNLRNTADHQQPVSSERVTATPIVRSRVEQFLHGMEVRSDIVCQYEDKELQLKALSCIPLSKIESNVLKQVRAIQKSAIKEGLPSDLCEASISEIVFLKELMKWFKHEFFKWVDSPICSSCNSSTKFCKIESSVVGSNNADRVEVYSCEKCNKIEKFPRYNNARVLLETRAGRCGEWGQCFTLFCRALKWDARFICDNTDHVWTEVYSQFQKKWLHCDPCECVIDKPLLYENGWKKKLDYIFAYSCDGVYDVTWRYSANHTAVLSRRSIVSESSLVVNLMKLIEKRRQGLPANRKKYLTKRHVIELADFLSPAKETNSEDYGGRTSGSLAWRLARGEISVDSSSSYVWKPTSDEVSAKKMIVRYCPAKDEYVNGSGSSVLSRWEKGVFEVKNLFRKEELDWKMVYLCRTEGSSTGSIIWKFDFGSTGLVVDVIQIAFSSTTYKNGVVRLTVCGGDTCVLVKQENGGFETIALKGETVITLKAELEGGEGDVAWQHAQLFRMPVSDASCEKLQRERKVEGNIMDYMKTKQE